MIAKLAIQLSTIKVPFAWSTVVSSSKWRSCKLHIVASSRGRFSEGSADDFLTVLWFGFN